jgi:hypothetical protein
MDANQHETEGGCNAQCVLTLHELRPRSPRDTSDRGGKESDGNRPSQKKICKGFPVNWNR